MINKSQSRGRQACLLLLMFFLPGCQAAGQGQKHPLHIEKGVLDLRHWDFQQDGLMQLSGQWEFYWNRLLTAEDFQVEFPPVPSGLITVPGQWNDFEVNGMQIGSRGFATYRLTVLLGKYDDIMSLKLFHLATAYKLYINGKLITAAGTLGESAGQMIPYRKPMISVAEMTGGHLEIIIQISNFYDKYGGILYYTPLLGTFDQMEAEQDRFLFIQTFLFGAILIISLYHLCLFFLRREDNSSLFFCLFCLTMAVWLQVIGEEHLIFIFFDFSWQTIIRIEYFFAYAAPPLFTIYAYHLFRKEFSSRIFYILISFPGIITVSTLFAPLELVLRTDFVFQFFVILNILYMIRVLIRALVHKQEGSKIFLAGFFIFAIAIVHDFLFRNQALNTDQYTHLGLIVFIIAQSLILSLKFSRSFKKVENYSRQLEDYSTGLEEKVKQRTMQLENAADEKVRFFINIAHETGTPLTLINNYLDKYIDRQGLCDELSVIRGNLRKLTKQMTDFLDIAKLDKGKILYNHDQIISLTGILSDCVTLFQETARRMDLTLTASLDNEIHVRLDPDAIDRIVYNLLDNAIKYTPGGGRIHVSLRQHADKVKLVVADTGIGINHEQIQNIFNPFYQASREKKNTQGIGVGLSIVKMIINSIHGNIEVQSCPGKGTEFIITLAAHELSPDDTVVTVTGHSCQAENPVQIVLSDTAYLKERPSLLFVEDNRELLAYLVNSAGDKYNVFHATNGRHALEKLEHIPKPDIIVSDIMMDVMDGYKFYDHLVRREIYRDVPFIFLSAKTSLDERIRGLSKGAVDYIPKPFAVRELLAKISALLAYRQSNRSLMNKQTRVKVLKAVRLNVEANRMINFENNCKKMNITRREKEIIDLLARGKLNKEICWELNITYNTVITHVKNIYRKCNVQNKVELLNLLYGN